MAISTKAEFIAALRDELLKRNITDNEILEDFEQHFAVGTSQGLSEADVCNKLGSPEEIAMQYISNGAGKDNDTGFAENNYNTDTASNRTAEKAADGTSSAKMAGVICLDIFVFSWAIPSLFALLIAYWAVMISFYAAGIAVICGGSLMSIFGNILFVSSFTGIMNIFMGISLIGLALIMTAFCISIWRGSINICKAIGRLHKKVFCGR